MTFIDRSIKIIKNRNRAHHQRLLSLSAGLTRILLSAKCNAPFSFLCMFFCSLLVDTMRPLFKEKHCMTHSVEEEKKTIQEVQKQPKNDYSKIASVFDLCVEVHNLREIHDWVVFEYNDDDRSRGSNYFNNIKSKGVSVFVVVFSFPPFVLCLSVLHLRIRISIVSFKCDFEWNKIKSSSISCDKLFGNAAHDDSVIFCVCVSLSIFVRWISSEFEKLP